MPENMIYVSNGTSEDPGAFARSETLGSGSRTSELEGNANADAAGIMHQNLIQDARTASNNKTSNEQIKHAILLIPPNISILIGF